MINIIYSMAVPYYDNLDYKWKEHPQKILKDNGITYSWAVCQPICDSWWFFNIKGVLNKLPKQLYKIHDFGDLNKLVGYGLAQDTVDYLMSMYND